jgi:hypothetical protein
MVFPSQELNLKYLLASLFMTSLAFADATITRSSGDIKVNGKAITTGALVKNGEEIVITGKKSFAQIKFDDGSRMLIKEGTLKLSPPEESKENLVQLIKGTIFVHKAKSDSPLKIKTNHSIMGVRGTKFFVQEDPKETYLCVCEGKVEISNGVSTEFITMKEDATVSSGKAFKKSTANQMMWDMANQGVNEIQ